jgi:hypothetical protein
MIEPGPRACRELCTEAVIPYQWSVGGSARGPSTIEAGGARRGRTAARRG